MSSIKRRLPGIGYEEENSKKAIQNLVPSKYKLRFGDVKPSQKQGEDIFLLHKDTVLLKEPDLHYFLLRCKRDETEPFMELAVETVLPGDVRKVASVIKERDAVLALLTDDLQDHDNQIQAIKYENVALQAQKDVYQAELQKCQDTISHLEHVMFSMRKILVKTTSSSL